MTPGVIATLDSFTDAATTLLQNHSGESGASRATNPASPRS
jgi:hypothetical protein